MEATGVAGGAYDGESAGTAAILDVFELDPVIGPDLASVDWAATPMGPPERWPQSLRTALSILLTSRFSMWMAWGPQLSFFCNAAYRRDTLGRKYPWALGRPASEVWAEIWDEINPRVRMVLDSGESTWDEALLLLLERSGYPEETYHTFSYSPLRDDAGAVSGMLCVVSEVTEQVVADRRMATLRDLGSDPTVVRTEQEILAFSSRQLERNCKSFPFTLTYLFDDGVARLAATSGIPEGHPAAPPTLSADDPDAFWPAADAAKGESAIVALDTLPGTPALPTGAWREPPAQAVVQPLLRQGGSPYGFLVAAVNRYRPLDDSYRGFIELAAGHIAAGIASARVYQAQRERAEELAELDHAKTVFFSNVSHEFRTPLTLIMGPVEELRTRLADADARTREELEVVRRNGLRLGKLVNTLLDFSRIEAGRMQARFAPVDLSALTAEYASVFRSAAQKAGLRFEVDCPALPEPVYVDPALWEKIVLNLVGNALKFTFDGSVRVAVRADAERALVTVADTGVGVPESEMPRLFERFHRIENARARSTEGSGIGLALVKELVTLHGGTITASSVEGSGTTFTVCMPFGRAHLPEDAAVVDDAVVCDAPGGGQAAGKRAGKPSESVADAFVQEALRWLPNTERGAMIAGETEDDAGESAVADSADSASADRVRHAPANVFVVDDNADMREYLARLMRGAGHRVAAFREGASALEEARLRAPELIVSDVMMPVMTGLDLVSALRQDPHTAGVPVLLLSARAGQEASIEGLEAGADDYLVKPFTAAELLARVRANVELSRLRGHHARWRNALVETLSEGFFVADERGTIVEINAAFTEILGYGPEGLPYRPRHPWWPDPERDPESARMVAEAFELLVADGTGNCTLPVIHRDGRRIWVSVGFSAVTDPDTGARMSVGTFRDVTAEHYAVQRDAAVAAVSLRLSRSGDFDEALRGVLEEIRGLWQAERVLAIVFAPDSAQPAVTATPPGADWDTLDPRHRVRLTDLRDGPPLITVQQDGSKPGVGVALEHPRGTLVLWLDLDAWRPFTAEDRLLLSVLAGHLTLGLRRAHQIELQRETSLALQRSILGPSVLPPGFAVRYEPAAQPLEVGGDWYDTVVLTDGRIGIVVGDCVGRGLEAATVMGQLRSACRALLLCEPRPDRVLSGLDQFAAGVPGALCTTVFCGVLDPATGSLTYSSAGHPPGVVAGANGEIALLEHARSFPLGIRPGAPRPCATEQVPARATLLLYTDGLVERRRRPLTDGIAEAGRAVRDERDAGVDELAERVMARMAPAEGYEDDVAVLLYRHPGPFEAVFPAGPERLAEAGDGLRGWLERCELPEATMRKVLAAAAEAGADAIRQAPRRSPQGTVRMRAEAFAEHVTVTVAETGRWHGRRRVESGHGDAGGHNDGVATGQATQAAVKGAGRGQRASAGEVSVDTSADGTVVTLHIGIDPSAQSDAGPPP